MSKPKRRKRSAGYSNRAAEMPPCLFPQYVKRHTIPRRRVGEPEGIVSTRLDVPCRSDRAANWITKKPNRSGGIASPRDREEKNVMLNSPEHYAGARVELTSARDATSHSDKHVASPLFGDDNVEPMDLFRI